MSNQKSERAKVGARLRAARERAHVTVEDAAASAEVQPLAIQKWERGTSLPSLLELRALLQTYGCMACDILFDMNPWTITSEQGAELIRASRDLSPGLRAKVDLLLAMHGRGVEPIWKVS